jgi:hypothetical protein
MIIVHKKTKKVLFESDHTTIKATVVAAVGGGADLRDANFHGAKGLPKK